MTRSQIDKDTVGGWITELTTDVVAWPWTGSQVATIANDAVTYAKMQNASANTVIARAANTSGDLGEVAIAASQLVGRWATGDVAPIVLGTNLSMSGTTLNAGVWASVWWETTHTFWFSITSADPNLHTFLLDTTSSACHVTLPPAASVSWNMYHIKKITSGATNSSRIFPDWSETIEWVAAPVKMRDKYGSYSIVSDWTQWFIVNKYIRENEIIDYLGDWTAWGVENWLYNDVNIDNNKLEIDWDKIVAKYGGNFVTVGTQAVRIKLYFADAASFVTVIAWPSILDTTAFTPTSWTNSWVVDAEIIRTSATSVRYAVSFQATGSSWYINCSSGELTWLTLSGATELLITWTSTGAWVSVGDIVCKMWNIQFRGAAGIGT